MPKPGEYVGVSGWIRSASYSPIPTQLYPQSHTFTQNYTFVFTPEYHKTTGAHACKNTHGYTGAHKRTCRPACKNADVQARNHMQECTHVCTGLHVCTSSTHASTQAHVGAHARTRARTRTGAHARTQRQTRLLICVGARAHARSFT